MEYSYVMYEIKALFHEISVTIFFTIANINYQ